MRASTVLLYSMIGLERVSTATDNFRDTTIISSKKEVGTTKSACAGCRSVEAAEIPKIYDNSRNVLGKVASTSTVQDCEVDEKALEGEYLILMRAEKVDETPIAYGQYDISFVSKVTVPQTTFVGDNRNDEAAH